MPTPGRHSQRIVTLAVGLMIVLSLPGTTFGAWKYYVRKSGSDSNHGKNANHAFQTIDKARQVMGKGDVCWVGAGTYEETVRPTADGTAKDPILFIADTSGAETGDSGPVILGAKNDFVISANGASYVEFHNFTIQRGSGLALLPSGVYANNCPGFKLVNCTLRNLLVGVAADEGDITLTDCTVEDIWISPMLMYKNNVTVTGTTFRDNSSYIAFHFALSSTDKLLKLVDCTIENNDAGPYCYHTKMHLENTLVQNNDSWGAIIVDGGLTTVNMTEGFQHNGGGLYLAKSAPPDLSGGIDATDGSPDDYVLSDLNLSNNGDYGLYASNCSVKLLNCTVENNGGYGLGLAYSELRDGTGTVIQGNANGVIGWTDKDRRKFKIQKAEIANNTGHAIVHYGHATANDLVEIKDSYIHDNGGWTLYSEEGDFKAKNSRFERNGGGIHASRPVNSTKMGKFELEKCVIDGITAGDALYAFYSEAKLKECTVSNVSGYGVQCHYGPLTIEKTTITNAGTSQGFAVYHYHAGPVSPSSPKLKIKDSSVLNGDGGVYADRTNVEFDDVDISHNRSWAIVLNYGSLKWSGDDAEVVDNNGYGIYVAGNDHNSTTRTFNEWHFVDNGDYGIYAVDCSLVLQNCVVERMTGWGMGLEHAHFTPINTPIQNNGKGIAVVSDALHPAPTLTGVVVTHNTGIGISHESSDTQPGQMILDNCTVSLNAGWGLLSYHGNVDLRNTTFANNTQGLYFERDPQTAGQGSHQLTNVTVRNITANDLVYSAGSSLTMTNCLLDNGPLNGVMCYGEDLVMQFCTVTNTGASGTSYGVYHYHPADDPAQRGDTVLDHCTITHNYAGPYGHNTNLRVDGCNIRHNQYWGMISTEGELDVDVDQRLLTDNGYGLYLEGNPDGNERVLANWNVSHNDQYGVYAVDCDLRLVDCVIEGMDQWGVGLVRSTLVAENSPIRNNGAGIEITSNGSSRQPVLTDVQVLSNSGIAVQHNTDPADPATLVLNHCTVQANGSYGLLSIDANLEAISSVFDGNQRGLRLQKNPALAGSVGHVLTGTLIQNHPVEAGLYAEYAPVTMTNCTVSSNTAHGVECHFADFHAEGTTFTGNGGSAGYAVYHADNQPDRNLWAELHVANSSFTGNGGGVYADHTHLTVDNCTLSGNLAWAIGCAYGDLIFANQASAINNNGSGLLVMGNTPDGTRRLTNFDLSDNGNYGLFAVDCNLVLENCQLTGMQNFALGLQDATLAATNTPIVNNGSGVHVVTSATTRDPQLTGLHIAGSTNYAVYHESDSSAPGTLTMRSCQIEGYGDYGLVNLHGTLDLADVTVTGTPGTSGSGIYCFRAPLFTAQRLRVTHNDAWGLLCYGSNVALNNSVVAHNLSGAYFYNYTGEDTAATILHATFGENAVYGLVQHEGTSTIHNSIFATSGSGSIGLQVASGTSSHSHNLFEGYTEACSGTTLTADELIAPARFVDVSAGQFLLVGSSSAINRGMDLSGTVDQDMLGFARPMYGKWDIGAYEYTSASESAHVVEWQELK